MKTTKKMLTEKYLLLKKRLGKIPSILECYTYGEIDPMLLIHYSGSYYHFLKSVDKEYTVTLSQRKQTMLEFVSKFIADGKRPHELLILKQILEKEKSSVSDMMERLEKEYHIKPSKESIQSAIGVLEGTFLNSPSDKKKYADIQVCGQDEEGRFRRLFSYHKWNQENEYYIQLDELIEFGLRRFEDLYYPNMDDAGLTLYQKYSRKDVCRILNWEKDESSAVYGYRIKNNTCPIFVTYHKQENISESTKYKDAFINPQIFSWMTRSSGNWRQESEQIMHCQENGLKIYLFIKKSDGEGTDFYYMGQCTPLHAKETVTADGKPLMNITLKLEKSVNEDIYDYLEGSKE